MRIQYTPEYDEANLSRVTAWLGGKKRIAYLAFTSKLAREKGTAYLGVIQRVGKGGKWNAFPVRANGDGVYQTAIGQYEDRRAAFDALAEHCRHSAGGRNVLRRGQKLDREGRKS